jgi:PST family polysaccharide transporter
VRFSILLATVDRTAELDQMLGSLARQTWRDFEVLIVDQNPDYRLEEVVARYAGQFPIRRMQSERGHSKAFNTGRVEVTGEVVAFPDDDCWYPEDLLERVAGLLQENPGWSGVTGREMMQPGFQSGGRWDYEAGAVTRANVWRRAISFSMFLRAEVVREYAFDETLGVGAGTPWGAGEETDYLLRLIAGGHRIYYDPSLGIWHMGRNGPYTEETYGKARRYARGIGRVLRKHQYSPVSVSGHLIRPMGGAALSLSRGNTQKARYHWSILVGRVQGWCARRPSPDAPEATPSRGMAARLAQNDLVQNAAALYGVQMVRKILPLIIVPYLARTLGPAGWGVVAFTQAIAEFVVLVIEFGFNLSATREIARFRNCRKTCADVMAGVLGAQCFLASMGVLGMLAAGRIIPLLRDNPKLVTAGLFYAIAQGFVPLWFFQGLERMRLAAVFETCGRLVGLISILFLVRSPEDTWLALFIQGVAPAFTTAAGLIMAYRAIPCRIPTWPLVRNAMSKGWPLFVFRSGESLFGVLNAFILGLFASPTQVGYFASAEKISRAIFGLLNPIREALYPRLSSLAHHAPRSAAQLARVGVAVMAAGGIFLSSTVFLFAPLLIRLLMGQAFGPAVTVLRILSILPILLSLTHSAGLQWLLPLGMDMQVNRVILRAGALNLVLALVLAPRFFHIGMAWAVVTAEAFVCLSMLHLTLSSTSLLRERHFSASAELGSAIRVPESSL